MKYTTTTDTTDLGPEELVRELGAEDCSPELKGKILAKFGEVLFKKLVLLLSDDDAKAAISELSSLSVEEGMVRLIAILDAKLANAEIERGRVFAETVAEFKIPAA